MENNSAGVVDRLGIGYDALKAIKPSRPGAQPDYKELKTEADLAFSEFLANEKGQKPDVLALTFKEPLIGPAGVPIEWDTEVSAHVPNEVLGWRTVPGAVVDHAGLVHFEPADGGTRVHIQMSYNPPAGAVGHAVVALLGQDPKRAMDEDLVRLKSLLEEGKTTAHGDTVHRDKLSA